MSESENNSKLMTSASQNKEDVKHLSDLSFLENNKGWLNKIKEIALNIVNVSKLLNKLATDNQRLQRQVNELALKLAKQAGYIEALDKFIEKSVENEVRKQLGNK